MTMAVGQKKAGYKYYSGTSLYKIQGDREMILLYPNFVISGFKKN